MMAITHAAIACAGVSLLLGTADPLPLALAVLGSQIPDIDTTTSVIGQVFYPVSNWIEDRFPHRSVTHSLLATAVIAAVALPVGFALGDVRAAAAVPVGHLLSCFSDCFTRQGVQLFWPDPAWAISVSNPRRRLVTGGPGEYWVLSVAVALLVLGCWMANSGGITGQVNQSLGLRDAAIATYNSHADRNVYAKVTGVWADDRSRADGRYLVLGTAGSEFIITDGQSVYQTGKGLVVDKLTTEVGEASSRQTQTLTFSDEEPGAKLQPLAAAYANQQVLLSGALSVDYPEGITLPPAGRGLPTAVLSGESLELTYHPLNLALTELHDQWVTGQLTLLLP